jgi:chromatin remodeling complex protein RSC6
MPSVSKNTIERVDRQTRKQKQQKNFNDKLIQMSTFANQIKDAKSFKKIDSYVAKQLKLLERLKQDTTAIKSKRSPSSNKATGFNKESDVTDETLEFLGKDKYEGVRPKVTWAQLTKAANDYIRIHDLKNKENKRLIDVDEKLAKLLNYNQEVSGPLSFTSMQKHFQNCFPHLKKNVMQA